MVHPSLPRLTTVAVASVVLLCGANVNAQPVTETAVVVDPSGPGRIKFEVHGDPGLDKYPEIERMQLSPYEKVREGMRRHAADVLAERGLCPNGFEGPKLVRSNEFARQTRWFTVECKE